MSAQNLMDGFDAYTDADELGAAGAVAQEQESILVSALASALVSAGVSLTAEHTC